MPAAIYWAQAPDELRGPPTSWQLEYALDASAWGPLEIETPARPCSRCWEAWGYPPRELGWIRARAVWESGEISPWTPPTPLPEPGFAEVLALLVVALVFSARARRR